MMKSTVASVALALLLAACADEGSPRPHAANPASASAETAITRNVATGKRRRIGGGRNIGSLAT